MAAVAGRPPRLLALRALGLGDLLTAVPALRALADAFPGHRRLLACPAALAPLARLTGAVDEVVDAQPLEPLPVALAGVELAVNLHGRGPQSHRLLARLQPRRTVAFACAEAGFANGPAWREREHEVDRWCRLLGESGIPADPERLWIQPPAADPPAVLRGATLIHPGAAAPSRRWPAERFAAVASAERDAGRTVAITGTAAERDLGLAVAHAAGLATDAVVAGRTGVVELAALVAVAGRVVSGDTGVAHLATALRTPSVIIFGPTPPALWGPPAGRAEHRALWRGQRGDPHGNRPDRGLLRIEVADVLTELAALPARMCRNEDQAV